ncbi:MAG: hypothetical protein JM58_04710 [Peptococcaceae bacterium BICA1-8]|nr:MAG: hypothetical protein JM58_04710 [Peptococcaceae bacterium BICA1-8]
MKPLLLRIAGLNSFREEQVVDFSDLGQTGIFGIFGPTGSGKSTVLDAVTLALYGKVERAKGGTQGIINQNEDRLYVHFSFQIGGKKYTAERTYKRGNDGSINQYSCRFRGFDDLGNESVIADKKREMDEKVQEILGLTVDDFTRAVVLPQGKFQEFLTLQGADRRKMLQRIFALEKYGEQLVKKIRGRVTKAQLELEMKEKELDFLGDASEKAIQKARKDFKETEKRLAQLKETLDAFNKELDEYKEIRQLTQELTEVNKDIIKLALEEPDIKKMTEKLDLANKGEKLRIHLEHLTNGEEALSVKTIENKVLEEELIELQSHYAQIELEYKKWDNKHQKDGELLRIRLGDLKRALEDEEKLDSYAKILLELRNEYRNLDETVNITKEEKAKLESLKIKKEAEIFAVDEKLRQKEKIVSQDEEIKQQEDAWKKLLEVTSRLEKMDKELNSKVEQVNGREIKKNELLAEVQEVENNNAENQIRLQSIPLPELSLEEIYTEKIKLQSITNLIEPIRDSEKNFRNKEKELEENNSLLTQQENLFTKETQTLEGLWSTKTQLIGAITFLAEKEREIERGNYALSLRETLESGQPCPVCGSLEHNKPVYSEASQNELFEEISLQLALKKQELAQVEGEIEKQNKFLASREANLEVLRKKNDALKAELEEQRIRTEEGRLKLPKQWVSEKTDALISLVQAADERLLKNQKELAESEKIKEKLNKENQDNESKLNALRQKLSAIEAELRLILDEKENMQGEISNKLEKVKLIREEFIALAGDKSGEEVENLVALLKSSRIEMKRLQQEKGKLAKELDDQNISLTLLEKKLARNEQELKGLEEKGSDYKKHYEDLNTKINKITDGKKAKEVKTEVESHIQVIVNNLNKYKDELENSKNKLEDKKQVVQNISLQIIILNNDIKKYQNVLQGKMLEYQFVSQGHLQDSLCTEEERQVLAEEIRKYGEERLLTEDRNKSLLNKLANRNLSEEQWTQFIERKSQTEEEEKRERRESIILDEHLEKLKRDNTLWLVLEKEIKELTSLLDHLDKLDKLFKYNTFVEFIAEEQLMNVAIDASRRLGELTSYRYALEVDSEGGFIIRDDTNGGLRRPVATLSGGETFLTSLALALALSSQIQLRGKYPLEFFFLDEGFGTLDSHLLETVMNSLERLHIEKMTIGIISHVPELKARIPRSLIVEPAEKGGKGTRLRLEVQ